MRLHGIDAPEKRQAFGTRARQYAGNLAHEKLVRVEVKNLDRNGRTVGVVILPDGRDLSHELVRAGFAWWFEKYARNDRKLECLEQEARAAQRGLWADASPVAPWEYRRESGTCVFMDFKVPDSKTADKHSLILPCIVRSISLKLTSSLGGHLGRF